MSGTGNIETWLKKTICDDHAKNDYFSVIKEILLGELDNGSKSQYIDVVYSKLLDEIKSNISPPTSLVKFGTSGWRGILGKDINCSSVVSVTTAIIAMYEELENDLSLAENLGVKSIKEAQEKGCVVGYDNRFGGEELAKAAMMVLTNKGFKVYYAGESTTGVISAAVLHLGAAFSINLTPSHNPFEYGGYKYNAADAGPAAKELTDFITKKSQKIISEQQQNHGKVRVDEKSINYKMIHEIDSLAIWTDVVKNNEPIHGIDYNKIIDEFESNNQCVVVIDSVHGASRLHVSELFKNTTCDRLIHLRGNDDVTFGGVSPEPSSANMNNIYKVLSQREEKFKLGAIIDPDGDRIRFTDGTTEISMNQFGAMAYHFLHERKGKAGMVAKTVATSNFANCLAKAFGEEVYEPRVGFKEFKPVIGKALVYFEESDGISIIGHTPEKDAYIGLLLALDLMLTEKKNIGEYLHEIESQYGSYYPDRDGISVSLQGEALLDALSGLEKYTTGETVAVGEKSSTIAQVIDIDGRKMIFEDGSWIMIRPSGTEPKVRFYVESRTANGTNNLVVAAKKMLGEIGLI